MRRTFCLILIALLFLQGCGESAKETNLKTKRLQSYLDFAERDDQFTGGIKMIPITSPGGEYKVWTKRVGNNPRIKVLLLHGGPGGTHEVYHCFDGYLPSEGIEYIYYDQLKRMIISNMMASAPEYNQYAQEVLGPQMAPDVLREVKEIEANNDYSNPPHMELLLEHYYTEHLLRMPVEEWPQSVNLAFRHMNPEVYVYMQGPSEFGIAGDSTLKNWDVTAKLPEITVPTLVIGATYDTMDPKHMEWMSEEVANGRFLLCPRESHLSQYDDQKTFFQGLVKFIEDVDQGNF